MSEARKVMPTKTLLQGMVYTPAASTDLRAKFEAIRRQMRKTKTVQLVRNSK